MPERATRLDALFHALAVPVRREMVRRLCKGPASVSELAKPFSVSLPAVVQHLQILEASGLVRSVKVGRVRTCHLRTSALKDVEKWIVTSRANWESRLDRLAKYLGEEDA